MTLKKVSKFKNKIVLYTTLLSLTTTLSNCNLKKDNKKAKIVIETNDILNKEYNDVEKIIDNTNPKYNYEEYYIKEFENNDIIEKTTKTECTYQYDGNIDNIINNIKINSDNFVNNNNTYLSIYEQMQLNHNLDFNEILKNVIQIIIDNNENNINEDICNMNSLVIVVDNDINNKMLAYYKRKDNMIVINDQLIINNVNNFFSRDYKEILEDVLLHEFNHLRQYPCQERIEQNENSELLEYDKKYISILMETSAESELYNLDKVVEELPSANDFSYQNERTYESELLLLALGKNNDVNKYYEAVFDTDINKFYNFFNVKTKEEKQNLFYIIYTIDALSNNNELGNYLNNNIDNKVNNNINKEVGYTYKIYIFKNAIKNLLEATKENKLSLEENIILLNVLKNTIVQNTEYIENIENNYVLSYDREFVTDIYNIENEYVEYISKYYNKSIEYIRGYEKNNINQILLDMSYIATTKYIEVPYIDYKDISYEMMDKYKILKAILYPQNNIQYSYQSFIENNNLELIKK